jgi:hypothetical protein
VGDASFARGPGGGEDVSMARGAWLTALGWAMRVEGVEEDLGAVGRTGPTSPLDDSRGGEPERVGEYSERGNIG